MFTEKDYGVPISEEISEFIRRWTDKDDRAEASRETGVGSSTVRDVVFRRNSLTEDNSRAIIWLIKKVKMLCDLKIEEAEKDIKYFESLKQ